MTLDQLGWNGFFQANYASLETSLTPVRVMEEQRGSIYRVHGEAGESKATLSGTLRSAVETRGDLPAVGDWVTLRDSAIEHVLPRRTSFSRQAAGEAVAEQVIAANVDTVFVVTSLNRELNLARLERYVTLVWEGGAVPVVLLNKSDLVTETDPTIAEVQKTAPGVEVLAVSALEGSGLDALQPFLQSGKTLALVGSSGVGKSTLTNRLLGHEMQSTGDIRTADDRGRHTTTSRRLIPLAVGALLLDTPGMREMQLWEGEEGIARAFPEIDALSGDCRFRDCTHQNEPGCAVRAALEADRLDPRRMESFRKLEKELHYAAIKQDAALRSEQNKKWRKIHKEMRNFSKTDRH